MELLLETQHRLSSPCFDGNGRLYVTCTQSGSLLLYAPTTEGEGNGSLGLAMSCDGQPKGLAIDPTSSEVFLADPVRQAILKVEGSEVTEFVQQFEGRHLLGPNSLCMDGEGELLFTDAGLMGDTNLGKPKGSVFRTVQRKQQLVRLCGPSLAYPSGIAVSRTTGSIFVGEMCNNRIIRFVPTSDSSHIGSVFTQFSGLVGPVAVAIHPTTDEVYVARYEVSGTSGAGSGTTAGGVISVLFNNGEEKGLITVPGTGQLSGIAIDEASNMLIVTEDAGESSRIYRMKL